MSDGRPITEMESLAAWVAEKLGDTCERGKSGGLYFITETGYVRTVDAYLSCKNVAGRVLDGVVEQREKSSADSDDSTFDEYIKIDDAIGKVLVYYHGCGLPQIFTDTPQALHDIALACGWEAPDA